MKKIRNIFVSLLVGANIVAVVAMLASGYSYIVSPEHFSLIAVLSLGFPVTVVVNICFLFFWMFFGWKKLAISIAGLLLCYVPVRSYFPINVKDEPAPDALKVMSFNVQGFLGNVGNEPEDVGSVVDYLVDQHADIACLQEAYTDRIKRSEYLDKLSSAYPYSMENKRGPSGSSVAILSRYPILSGDSIAYDSDGNLSVAYRLKIGSDTVTVINNHLESTHMAQDDREGFRRMVRGDMGKEYMAAESKNIVKTLARSAQTRAKQADAVAEYIRTNVKGRLIVCGDFNDSPVSYAHHRVKGTLLDCFEESGRGVGWSYCHNAMRVRIDHIFCSRHYVPQKCIVDNKNALSDHYSVICWLEES